MDDLIERARAGGPCSSDIGCAFDILNEAADEIERLREALNNFCDAFEPHMHEERCQICSAAYHEARAALKEKE